VRRSQYKIFSKNQIPNHHYNVISHHLKPYIDPLTKTDNNKINQKLLGINHMTDQISTPDSPNHTEVVSLRRQVRQHFKLRSDSAGRELCGRVIHVTTQAWDAWETGKNAMHPAFWELANIKLTQLLNHEEPLYSQWLPRIEELQTRKAPSQEAKAAAQARKEARKAAGF